MVPSAEYRWIACCVALVYVLQFYSAILNHGGTGAQSDTVILCVLRGAVVQKTRGSFGAVFILNLVFYKHGTPSE
jgi:TRAP-type uncharacterized transport system fused permease subunit